MEEIIQFDKQLLLMVNGSDSVFLDYVVLTLTNAKTWIPLYLALLYVVMMTHKPHWRDVLLILAAVHLILMILVVIFTFIDQKRMLKQGKCIWLTENGTIIVWKFADSTLVLAFVLEALYLFINIAAAMDFLGRI